MEFFSRHIFKGWYPFRLGQTLILIFSLASVEEAVGGITMLIGSLDDFAPFRSGVAGLKIPSVAHSGSGVNKSDGSQLVLDW